MTIDQLELSTRSSKGLESAGITTVEQLVMLDLEQLEAIENLGKGSLIEICWKCVYLLSGRMDDERQRLELGLTPQACDWEETLMKARKFDNIIKIAIS